MNIKRALISVSDKTGLLDFVKFLDSVGVEIICSKGTGKFLKENNIKVRNITDLTDFPEILGGRVKTLHPKVYGGILARKNKKEDVAHISEHNMEFIDMVIVNLYPFEECLKKPKVSHEELIENIDIGGPSMLRAAAKNYEHVIVLSNPDDYSSVVSELKENYDVSINTRKQLAAKIYERTSYYDKLISDYLNDNKVSPDETKMLNKNVNINLTKAFDLRYGENPHQKAAYYLEQGNICWEKLHGKELSYNNILDMEVALNIANDFDDLTVVIVKHNNPCGVGQAQKQVEAYKNALSSDPVSAFGGIVSVNRKLDEHCAHEIVKVFTECVIATEFTDKALEVLRSKKNLRVIKTNYKPKPMLEIKKAFNGALLQERDAEKFGDFKVVTEKNPTDKEMQNLKFAWVVAKHVKSNAIVIAKENIIIGIGAGQMSRVDATELAIKKSQNAKLNLQDTVLASDAFFPFKDSVERVAPLGVKAIIQPGGSVRDSEVIDACNKLGIAMVFTGQRHFKH